MYSGSLEKDYKVLLRGNANMLSLKGLQGRHRVRWRSYEAFIESLSRVEWMIQGLSRRLGLHRVF